ncbi:hypothetical protein [Pedobacter sp.]
MKNFKFIIILFIAFLFSCNIADNDKKLYNERTAEFVNFINFYRSDILKKEQIISTEHLLKSRQYDDIWQIINLDSLKTIKLTNLDIEKLSEYNFKNIEIITEKELERISYNLELQKKFFKENSGYFTFSQPYFSEDNQYILLYISYTCGNRCGNSSIQLFKKEKKSWVLIQNYAEGIS